MGIGLELALALLIDTKEIFGVLGLRLLEYFKNDLLWDTHIDEEEHQRSLPPCVVTHYFDFGMYP